MPDRTRWTVVFFLCLGLVCCCGNAWAADSATPAASSAATPPASPAQPPLRIGYPSDVLTYHYNAFRQGYTAQETTLMPSNVNVNTFGKINFFAVDGKVDAQPLFVNKQSIGGNLNDTLFVVTENDSAYAFSANSGHQFWHV